jgi:hypothetical protein
VGSYGGAIYAISQSSVSLFAANCTISANNAIYDGGAVLMGEDANSVWENINCTNNTATGSGGCFSFQDRSAAVVSNSSISSNRAATGGAISMSGTLITVVYSIFL